MAIESNATAAENKGNKKSSKKSEQKEEKKSLNKINRININDLVASVINQHTSGHQTINESPNNYTANNVTTDSNNNKQSLTVEDFDRLVQTSQTTTATIGGIKVTVLGAQETSPQLVSPPSTSTSLSVSTNSSFTDHQKVQHKVKFDPAVNNVNARQMLEKPQKDLHRQQQTLNKLASSFHDEQSRSQSAIIQQFNKIRQLIDQRQATLLGQLNAVSSTGSRLLQQRQTKAGDLRVLVDNATHLSDDEVLELKADIKHFVSERQLDEELGSVKLFEHSETAWERLADSISSYGTVQIVQDKYAKQRPPLNELLNDNMAAEIQKPNKNVKTPNTVNVDNNNNNNNNRSKAKIENEGGFIEVKSRSNRNKPNQPSKQGSSNNANAKLLAQNNFNRLSTVN